MLKLPPTKKKKNYVREFSLSSPNKPQDKEEACLKMAAVDMAGEDAATQLLAGKNQDSTGSVIQQTGTCGQTGS